jgi:hypothetical protein
MMFWSDKRVVQVARVALVLAPAMLGAAMAGATNSGCSSKEPKDGDEPAPSNAGSGAPANAGASANAGSSSGSVSGSGGTGTQSGMAGMTGSTTPPPNKDPVKVPPPPAVMEMLDPNVDWMALTLVYPSMYSAYDGEHTFQVPVHVDGATVELKDWKAIPASAVTFDPDPDTGGVLITVNQAVAEVTIAVSTGDVGGTAPLHITSATPAQWAAGEARYRNGVEFTLDIDFAQIIDPNWMPPPAPPDLACNNCHSTGAKYFEIQHTPTQVARYSDDDLTTILTMGTKPAGAGFRLLPPKLGSISDVDLYKMFHKWEATPDEVKGVIVYMRSLTPEGQGDILLPDGTFVPPGGMP